MTDIDETYVTDTLEDGETELGAVNLASLTADLSIVITDITTSRSARVRLYSDYGVATSDLSRQPWEDPASWADIVFDVGLGLADTDIDHSLDEGWELALTPDATADTGGRVWMAVTNFNGQPRAVTVNMLGTMEIEVSADALYPNPNIDFPATYRTAGAPGPVDPDTYSRTVTSDDPFDPTDDEERAILLAYATYVGGFSRKAFSEVDGDWTW